MGLVFRFLNFLGWGMYNTGTCMCMVNMKEITQGVSQICFENVQKDGQTDGRVRTSGLR